MDTMLAEAETYEIFEVVGHGSVSTIHDGYDHTLKREVAIKELRPEFQSDPEVAEAFWGEATLLAGLKHANILGIYGIDRQRHWIVMELMRSSVKVEASQHIAFDRIRDILRQSLDGLGFLHSLNRLHGQIRMESLLVDVHGNVKLSNLSDSDVDGEFRRPDEDQLHSAPEVLNPRHFGEPSLSSDLYCLGIVALQLLAGEKFLKLFKGMDRKRQSDPMAWSAWHASSEPIGSLEALVPDVPKDLLSLVHGLTQKQVGLRFSTASEAIGAISPKWGGPAHLAECEDEHGEAAAINSEGGSTVTYNSPNFYSPKFSQSAKSGSDTWHTVLEQAFVRFPIIRNRTVLLSTAGVFIGLLLLGLMLVPEADATTQENTVEKSIEKEPAGPATYRPPSDYSPELEPVVKTGKIKIFTTAPSHGPKLGQVRLFIDGAPQEIRQGTDEAMTAFPSGDLEQMYFEDPQISMSEIVAVQDVPGGPILVAAPEGSYKIEVIADHFNRVGQVIDIVADNAPICELQLTPELYEVRFLISPPHAELSVDGLPVEVDNGIARQKLSYGNHEVVVTAKGFDRKADPVKIISDKSHPVNLDEIPVVSRTIDSYPQGADVFVDDILVGQTPVFWTGRDEEHAVRLEMPGFRQLASTFKIEKSANVERSRLFWYLKR